MIMAGVQRISHHVEREFSALARRYGLGPGDLRILLVLARSAPDYALRPTEIYQQLLITSGAVTKQVDRLVAFGLVRRTVHPDDVRILLIALEERGHVIAREAMMAVTTSFCGIQDLNATQKADVAGALDLLLKTAQNASASPAIPKGSEP
ncbi:MAG: MarR family winged helix-turn-helix transcriptional regulator [Actinomycetales bacterium]